MGDRSIQLGRGKQQPTHVADEPRQLGTHASLKYSLKVFVINRIISGASWNGNGQILSGRSADNNGTWFGISRGGRVAFLVSVDTLLDHVDPQAGSELYPIEFLEGNMTPQDFANDVAQGEEVDELLSFSLIVADMTLNSMVHIRKPVQAEWNVMIQPVPFGVHTLSPYEGLDAIEPWDLLVFDVFNQMTAELGNNPLPPLKEIAGIMYDDAEEEDAVFLQLAAHPQFGMQLFGTTSTTALAVERTGRVRLFERYRLDGGWHTHDFDFQIQH
ncbi:uncharacterized protein LOC9326449 [Arabidopsis lyrata subsp. lyrata]|uniref:uncharacterized protein LOC9326449 n=1 Tax=Arabidopsis lyrata subsp. lyrata TaxID=81972 RepID=UPI000A29B7A0|nr:uncharacterized protein LOC9326449 [Arabidopsis lyrata subsp. lyrata]|eukprot:XP_020869867.1 uncharacterized protein LOC9326449 [Arabidopsis lyrata subsp. lyrata]